ncbi:MAG: Hsp70 family protein, partial [Gammaproteobacteria bacterium]|nr:Hsp70 family protein [Gammaproteobacteria bacterium]
MGDRVGIGIDFGTTNTAAAVFDGQSVRLVGLEEDSPILPSATYIDRDLRTQTGRQAIDSYVGDNTGRTVELIPEVIGEASLALSGDSGGREGPHLLTRKIYGQPVRDVGLRGRLFRGTKRLLGRKDVRRLMVFDHPFRLVALVTPILLRIREALREVGDDEPRSGCMGHPVNFEGAGADRNALALSRLGEAYGHAGFDDTRFFPEPVAAAVGYLHANPGTSGTRILTVDFGGGTLDLCVLERTGDRAGFRTVATHGIALGGDRIDQRIFSELLFPLLGKGERWKRRGTGRMIETPFPFQRYEKLLLNWAVTYLLSQNWYTAPVLDCIAQDGPARFKFRRLRDLIQQNYS